MLLNTFIEIWLYTFLIKDMSFTCEKQILTNNEVVKAFD